jgi:hypothetical protein
MRRSKSVGTRASRPGQDDHHRAEDRRDDRDADRRGTLEEPGPKSDPETMSAPT